MKGRWNGPLLLVLLVGLIGIAVLLWGVVLPSVNRTLSSQQISACRSTYYADRTKASDAVSAATAAEAANTRGLVAALAQNNQPEITRLITEGPKLTADTASALAKQREATDAYDRAATLSFKNPAQFLAERC